MTHKKRFILVAAVICASALLLGCLQEPRSTRAFSQDWAEDRGQPVRERERNGNNNGDNDVLLGNEEGVRVELENGRPRVRMGENGGLEADVNVRSGRPEGGVGYRWEW